MKSIYRFLLLLYPPEHRAQFAEEMLQVFQEARNERRHQGWAVGFFFAEITGLVAGAVGAWFGRKPAARVAGASPSGLPQELDKAQQRVDLITAAMVRAIAKHQFEKARVHSNQEREARENLRVLREKYQVNE